MPENPATPTTTSGAHHENCPRSGTGSKSQIHEIALDQAEQALPNAKLVLDVREPDEYRAGHLPGAVNIPRGLLEFKMSATPAYDARDLAIVLYCKTSGRAALAAQALKAMGYTNVSSIEGGFDAWAAAGKTVVKPDQPSFE